jgi:hypothetical protein
VGICSVERDMSADPQGESASNLLGMRIAIKRFGDRVQIILQCHGDYQAIELYERVVEAAQRGKVTLDLSAR